MSEKSETKRFGGTPQPNSGRGKFKKGDAVVDKFVVDIKEFSRSFGLSKAVWAKICTDAVKQGKRPALNVVLGGGDERRVRMWVISDADMHEYLELLEAQGD